MIVNKSDRPTSVTHTNSRSVVLGDGSSFEMTHGSVGDVDVEGDMIMGEMEPEGSLPLQSVARSRQPTDVNFVREDAGAIVNGWCYRMVNTAH